MNSRFTDAQKLQAVRDVESGSKTLTAVCKEFKISSTSYYGWKSKVNGSAKGEVHGQENGNGIQTHLNKLLTEIDSLKGEMNELRMENRELKDLYMDLLLKNRLPALKEKKANPAMVFTIK